MKRILCSVFAVFLTGCAVQQQPADGAALISAQRLVDQGVVHLRRGDTKRAEAAFFAAYEVHPSAMALDGMGCVALLEKRFPDAESFFQQALNRDPRYAKVYGNMALLYEMTGRNSEALEMYRRALAADPENIAARNNFAGLLYDYSMRDGTNGQGALQRARGELLKAQALREHPIIEEGLVVVRETPRVAPSRAQGRTKPGVRRGGV